MTHEEPQDFNPLVQAQKEFSVKDQAFGGPDGSAVKMEDITDLVSTQLRIIWLEGRGLVDNRSNFMRGNPLTLLQPWNIDFANSAVQTFALSWFRTELERLKLIRPFAEIHFGYSDKRLSEIDRKMRARQKAIGLLEAHLADRSG